MNIRWKILPLVAVTIGFLVLAGCLQPTPDESAAEEWCGKPDVAAVYMCEEGYAVVSSLVGAGRTFYRSNGSVISCPVVAPKHMSDECKAIFFEEGYCGEEDICES